MTHIVDEIPFLRPYLPRGECHRAQIWSPQRSAAYANHRREPRGPASAVPPTTAVLNEDGGLLLQPPEHAP